MPAIACNQVIGTGFVSAFKKNIVIRITAHLQAARGYDDVAAALDELQQLQANSFADTQLGAGQHVRILLQNRAGHLKAGGFGGSNQESGALKAFWFESGGNQHIGVDDKAERKH